MAIRQATEALEAEYRQTVDGRSDGVAFRLVAANPLNLPRLRLKQEAQEVSAALRQARLGAQFRLGQQWAVRSNDLLDALLRERPVLVHFAGHGSSAGELYLEDLLGRGRPVPPAALATLIGAAGSVRGVLLNACWTDALAEALLTVVACVVGVEHAVRDDTAVAFAAAFYRTLADGESVATAVTVAQAAALAATGGEVAVKLRTAVGVDATLMRLATDTTRA